MSYDHIYRLHIFLERSCNLEAIFPRPGSGWLGTSALNDYLTTNCSKITLASRYSMHSYEFMHCLETNSMTVPLLAPCFTVWAWEIHISDLLLWISTPKCRLHCGALPVCMCANQDFVLRLLHKSLGHLCKGSSFPCSKRSIYQQRWDAASVVCYTQNKVHCCLLLLI